MEIAVGGIEFIEARPDPPSRRRRDRIDGVIMGKVVRIIGAVVLALASISVRADAQATSGRRHRRYPPYGYGATGGLNSQLYVTGQVSGLGAFRGNVGYQAPNELRITIPSGSLDRFRRESVGLQQALRGQTYLPRPYYRRTKTASDLRGITSGMTAPGTNVPAESVISIRAQRPRRNVEVDARATWPRRDARYSPGGRQTRRYREVTTNGRWDRLGAGIGGALGVLRPQHRLDLERQIRQISPKDSDERGLGLAVNAAVDLSVDAEARWPSREALRPQVGAPAASANVRTNQDVMSDILGRMRQANGAETAGDANRPQGHGPPTEDAASGEPLLIPAAPSRQAARPARTPRKETTGQGRDAFELLDDKVIVVRSLAGTRKDVFNVRMAMAEKLLKEGRYYAAARRYGTAVLIDSDNPLAHMGLGMAFFGAGEPLSAAGRVYRAMKLFPPLMETILDIEKLIPTATINRRLLSLDGRIDHKDPDPMLIFLATYIRFNLGRMEDARRYAQMLRDTAKEDDVLHAYAAHVLSAAATTRPAARQEKPRE